MKTKVCTVCKQEKPATLEYFAKQSRSKDGLQCKCKICNKKYREENKKQVAESKKQWYKENKERISKERSEKDKKFRKEHKQEARLKDKIYREKHKEQIKIISARYYLKTKDKQAIYKKKYTEENKEKIAMRMKLYKENNLEKVRETKRKYQRTHKDIINKNTHNHRSRKRGLPSTLTTKQWNKIKLKFDNRCAYCGRELPLAQEHFIPSSKGGEYSLNNIVPSCISCNSSKNNKDFFEWYKNYEFYSKEREDFILKYLGYKQNVQQLKMI